MKENNKKEIVIKKLNEDDILEILLEHFQENELEDKHIVLTSGIIFGSPGKDLRFIGVFGDEKSEEIFKYDLAKIDKETEFNGDHAFLEKHPECYL